MPDTETLSIEERALEAFIKNGEVSAGEIGCTEDELAEVIETLREEGLVIRFVAETVH